VSLKYQFAYTILYISVQDNAVMGDYRASDYTNCNQPPGGGLVRLPGHHYRGLIWRRAASASVRLYPEYHIGIIT